MKKSILFSTIIIIVLLAVFTEVRAATTRKDYFLKPQVGFWFGPITPVYTTADDLDTDIGLGFFLRYNTPLRPLKIGFDFAYESFESQGVNGLTMYPVYGSLIYLLPIELPIKLQVKAGAGGAHITIEPDQSSQWDPLFMLGWEVSFPAGRLINIGLRVEYLMIYEGYATGAEYNGHFVNAGLCLYFNINL